MKAGLIKLLLLFSFIFFLSLLSSAQDIAESLSTSQDSETPTANLGPNDPGDGCDEGCPIDSWLAVLLVVGALYGVYKTGDKESIIKKIRLHS